MVLVVLLAGGGVYAWQHVTLSNQITSLQDDNSTLQRKADNNQKAADDAKKAADDATAQLTAAQAASTASTDFVTVSELGFKFKPGADLKDLLYFVSGNSVYFSTRSLMAASFSNNKAGCDPDVAPLGVVTKYKAGEVANGTKIESVKDAIKVGTFYILKTGPQSSCAQGDTNSAGFKTVSDMQTKQATALGTALKTAVTP